MNLRSLAKQIKSNERPEQKLTGMLIFLMKAKKCLIKAADKADI
jgi:hypothetical protein